MFLLKSAEEFLECLMSNDDALECPLPIFLISDELRDKEDACQTSGNLEFETVRWWEWSGIILNTNPGLGSPQPQFIEFDDEARLVSTRMMLELAPSTLESFLSVFFKWLLGGIAVKKGKNVKLSKDIWNRSIVIKVI